MNVLVLEDCLDTDNEWVYANEVITECRDTGHSYEGILFDKVCEIKHEYGAIIIEEGK